MEIKLLDTTGFKWSSSDTCYARGYLFDKNNQLYQDAKIIDYFCATDNIEDVLLKLKEANGSFCVIIDSETWVLAAVDRLSSIPLFYSVDENNSVSLYDKLPLNQYKVNDELLPSFLQTGYTLNNLTLISNCFRLSAGQYLQFNKKTKQLDVNYYYRHFHKPRLNLSKEEHFKNLHVISDNFIDRLIQSVGDNTIVLPLSGGYDSRYILTGLKKRDFKNVICYTYGRKDSFEIEIAEKVATKLGYPFIKIIYNPEDWKNLKDDTLFKEYVNNSFNYSSLTHIQDFLALNYLTQNKLLPENSVIVPGFCGDLLGGSYLPIEVLENKFDLLQKEGLENYLLRRHFVFNHSHRDKTGRSKKEISQFISQTGKDIQLLEDFISVNECWFTEHKVSKFVINSLRVYENFGFQWRMPLWDNELVDYWYEVPYTMKMMPKLYDSFLLESYFNVFNIDIKKEVPVQRSRQVMLLRKFLNTEALSMLKKAFRSISKKNDDINNFHYLKLDLLQDLEQENPSISEEHVNGVLAVWTIDKLNNNLK